MDISRLSDADRVALMEQAFSAVEEVCSQLGDTEWDLPTDCPAWTVKDNLSHLASFEAVATGTPPASDVDVSHLPHTAGNAFVELNEKEVEKRRPLHGKEILDEFREVTRRRIDQLRAFDDAAWQRELPTPVGTLQQRSALPIRILDVFYHEQDIRRAIGRPGHMDGDVARFVFERMASFALPRIVSKEAAAPEGSVVVFAVGAPGRTIAIETREGKGVVVDAPESPSARFDLSCETLFCLLGGRWTPQRARTDGDLRTTGDDALIDAILAKIVVVP